MNKKIIRMTILATVLMFSGAILLESTAEARAGRSSSFGSRGSRSYSAPTRSSDSGSSMRQPSRQSQSPAQAPAQPLGGGFMRGLAGGIMGGFLGSMLFSHLGFAGQGGMGGGGGIGFLEILLLAGVGYLIFSMLRRRREAAPAYSGQRAESSTQSFRDGSSSASQADTDGLSAIRHTDPWFKEDKFNDTAMDLFFKIQAAWMNRDIVSVSDLLTEEMRGIFQGDINDLVKKGHVNKLENIAVRNVEITEVWQESGQDYITVMFFANLLDYVADEKSGAVVSGSKTEPVKFEEFWTFTRPSGDNKWKLSAINQA